MGQVKYKAYLRRRFQPVGKQQEFLSKNSDAMTTAYRHYPTEDIYV